MIRYACKTLDFVREYGKDSLEEARTAGFIFTVNWVEYVVRPSWTVKPAKRKAR